MAPATVLAAKKVRKQQVNLALLASPQVVQHATGVTLCSLYVYLQHRSFHRSLRTPHNAYIGSCKEYMEVLAWCECAPSCCAVMNDIGTAPLQVVGYEGIFGCLAMFCVLLPIVQHTPGQDGSGLHEDSWETWHVGLRTLCHLFDTLHSGVWSQM